MILGFKTQFPWGEPTHFVEKITKQPGYIPKIHTLRKVKKMDRWKPGRFIHFAIGVRTKFYKQFHSGNCKHTQSINIILDPALQFLPVFVDGRQLTIEECYKLAENDGFDCYEDFRRWFLNEGSPNQIVHWTDFKY